MKMTPPPHAPRTDPAWCTTNDRPSIVAMLRVPNNSATKPDTSAAAGLANVCVVGGLAAHPYFSARIAAALEARGLRRVQPAGDALTGAALIAVDRTLPYEQRILRG